MDYDGWYTADDHDGVSLPCESCSEPFGEGDRAFRGDDNKLYCEVCAEGYE